MLARKLDMDEKAAYTIKTVLYSGMIALQRAQVATASLDARILLQHVLNISREQLLVDESYCLTHKQMAAYQRLIDERSKRKPVSQLIGCREFFGREFFVTQDTLDPRGDSETLIEAVLARCSDRTRKLRILDLGTGTGCLLLTLLMEYENATGLGVDKSEAALQVANRNTKALGVAARTSFIKSHWGEKIEDIDGKYDIVIANPPYIRIGDIPALEPEVSRYEPELALDGGEDGLDCYREIFPQLSRFLASDGFAVFEMGAGQEKDITEIAARFSLQVIGVKQDLAGITRCILMQLS